MKQNRLTRGPALVSFEATGSPAYFYSDGDVTLDLGMKRKCIPRSLAELHLGDKRRTWRVKRDAIQAAIWNGFTSSLLSFSDHPLIAFRNK